MISSIRAEFRKILTVRSTYLLLFISLLFAVGVSFYFEGYKGNTGSPASTLAPTAIKEIIANYSGLLALFISIIAILSIGHEHRYNTILYTLTANASRTKVLLSKIITISVFSILIGLIGVSISVGAYLIGLNLRDAALPTQDISLLTEIGKIVIYFLGYGLMGLLIGVLVRSVVGSIAFFLIVPTTIESLLSIVLKDNASYLPFTALDNIMGTAMIGGTLTAGKAILVFSAYLIAGCIVTWWLFLKRDAN